MKKREKLYRSLVENINEIVYRTDNAGCVKYISPNIEKMSGYRQSEIIEKGFIEFVHPEDRESRFDKYQEVMSGNKVISEFRILTKDKRILWVRTNAVPIIEDGQQVGMQGILSNITDRKEMEETLKKNAEVLEMFLKHMPVGTIIVDPATHKIIGVNPKAVQMIGIPKDKIINSVCNKIFCLSEDGKCPITDLGQTIDDAERKLITSGGVLIPIHKTAINMNIDGHNLLMECFVDISGHKRAEEERLTKERLRAVIETAGAVCHELNQPLQAIMGISELLGHQMNDKSPDFDKINMIKKQVVRMGEITNRLMHITRYETMKYLEKDIIDINKSAD
jgi:PAS domain S-box-containing protein